MTDSKPDMWHTVDKPTNFKLLSTESLLQMPDGAYLVRKVDGQSLFVSVQDDSGKRVRFEIA